MPEHLLTSRPTASTDAVDARARDYSETDERYRTLLDTVPVPLYATDQAGVIQHFNDRAAELWGREPSPGETAEAFYRAYRMSRLDGTPIPYPECPMALVVSDASGEVRDAEVTLERPDGSRVTTVVNSRLRRNERGEVIGALHCFFDVTQRRLSEETLRRSDQDKTEFLAMLAHELRNPLAPILVSLDLLRRARQPATHSGKVAAGSDASSAGPATDVGGEDHALAVLTRQVAQMVRLVDDLLDAARISLDKIAIRKERVEVSSVIRAAADAARPLCDRHDQELIVTLPAEPIFVIGDPARLAQIVGNLLSNAGKFTPPGGKIWLTASGSSEVTISVRDTGVGIARDQLVTVFKMFTQADRSTESAATGLGIGLALVKTLVEMHGGRVEATSPGCGQGTEVIVRLPLAPDEEAGAGGSSSTNAHE